ncbi:N-terminal double-transmembrane domain-containing protein [Pedobacter xixiisoli]|uniref:N-terminal double-transmembrane domain-containing protein n=2 Tax=Pedobacter xixiisoli TaxID=1476464 RepID=A0A285ZQQ6_9SPHI|nr:N-terminal double-transmembrane domain-containing protein [Pedobacter xixiisoli]
MALASLVLPILIHLWRVKQGKTLKIGSISLLGESAAASSRNLKISQWLLFVLRCLFFILLAILIAKPYLKGKTLTQNKAGWILLDERNLKPIYLSHQKKIDSLLKKGYQLRHFGKGFKRLDWKDTVNTNLVNDAIVSPLNYTSLLKQANHSLPNRFPIWVFAPKYTAQLDDVLPTLHLAIHWQSLPLADTSNVKHTQLLGKTYQAAIQGNAITYSLANTQDNTPLNVMVFPANTEDAKYVKAALSAIGSYLNQPIKFYNSVESKELDAIFWLSATSVPKETSNSLKTDGVLLKYANSNSIKNTSTLIINGNESEEYPVLKIRNVIKVDTKAETIWKDGYGQPVLTAEQQNERHNYTLYTQFNPQWTDLVWRDNFPQALMPILYHQKPTAFAFQQIQQIDSKQPIAVFEDTKQNKTRYAADKPLDQMIWVLAFIVLAVERLLNFRTKKLKVD